MPFLMNFSIFYIGLLTVWCIFDSTGAVRYGYIEIYEFYLSLYYLLLFDAIGSSLAEISMKTVFSFAIALTFRYICSV